MVTTCGNCDEFSVDAVGRCLSGGVASPARDTAIDSHCQRVLIPSTNESGVSREMTPVLHLELLEFTQARDAPRPVHESKPFPPDGDGGGLQRYELTRTRVHGRST